MLLCFVEVGGLYLGLPSISQKGEGGLPYILLKVASALRPDCDPSWVWRKHGKLLRTGKRHRMGGARQRSLHLGGAANSVAQAVASGVCHIHTYLAVKLCGVCITR